MYTLPYTLYQNVGNNSLSYQQRRWSNGALPQLIIPALIPWSIHDVTIGNEIVFEEFEDGQLKSCIWLKNFISVKEYRVPLTIFDNHNHALYFWIDALRSWKIQSGFELIHIDEHSDLWDNHNTLEYEKALNSKEYAWEFTNFSCNVGNYIVPAINCWIVGKMIRIENEFQIDEHMTLTPSKNSVLNIDLDFFAREMDFIPYAKKIACIKHLLPKVGCITVATSPFFIEQTRAIEALRKIFES